MQHRWSRRLVVALIAVGSVAAASCSSSSNDASNTGSSVGTGTAEPACSRPDGTTIAVPADCGTIQAAVDVAQPGDLILISPGVYHEAVDVTTDDLVIRGLDRNGVILDGEFELENGIRIIDADGVAVENMTAQNYTRNGFFWTTNINGYRGSYLTALRNGDYGIYAFGARNGVFEHSYGAGSPDAGFYIGQCYPCNAVMDDVVSEYNGLGYSGTNSGGDLYIVNSVFRYNRAGIVPNSGSYEGCAPERESTLVGNQVYSNNNDTSPAIGAAITAQENGIIIPGGVDNLVERNRVVDHNIAGINLVPFPESKPINGIPNPPDDDCLADAIPASPEEQADLPEELFWPATGNVVKGNAISDSGTADIIMAAIADESNEFCDNEFTSSIPADIETVAPCGGPVGSFGLEGAALMLDLTGQDRAESVPYDQAVWPLPGALENMPDAATAPATPAPHGPPTYPDVAAIALPPMPDLSRGPKGLDGVTGTSGRTGGTTPGTTAG
ncbi:MAG: right-handed parallel beta-helix repeat-containing protein [Acidimicrobiales bacterium]